MSFKKGQDTKWLYMRRYWYDTYPEDDNKKSIKAVWTYAKKATEGTGEESRLHDF